MKGRITGEIEKERKEWERMNEEVEKERDEREKMRKR